MGVITPSSLHHVATTRGSFIPDIDPREHRLMIHGMVDRPLIFTMDDLMRLPSVTRGDHSQLGAELAKRRLHVLHGARPIDPACLWHPVRRAPGGPRRNPIDLSG